LDKFLKEGILISRFVKDIFPQVDKALKNWQEYALNIPDPVLKEQALSSIRKKRFHCQGGSIYALYPGVNQEAMVGFIVAFQTISDYLDNLCDRVGCEEEKGFRELHRAMDEAIRPDLSLSDYYAYYPYKNDGGYLKALVEECRRHLVFYPSFSIIQEKAAALVSLYCDLQSLKHLNREIREEKMMRWAEPFLKFYPDLSPWEFGAASGSTLGVFMLAAASCQEDLSKEEARKIKDAYFPYIAGLHILLDYFIDQTEDQEEGDLNFVSYYRDQKETTERLEYFLKKAQSEAAFLKHPDFHLTLIKGLLALYLSDQKTKNPSLKGTVKSLIDKAGISAKFLYYTCQLLRKSKQIN
jgi:tetraprenyl-beta-curcumene synthase